MNDSKIPIFRLRGHSSMAPPSHMRLSVGANSLDGSASLESPGTCSRSEIDGSIEDCEKHAVMLKETDLSRRTINLGEGLFRQSDDCLNAWARIRSQMEVGYSSDVMKQWFDR